MEFVSLLRPVGVKNLVLSLFRSFNIEGREPYLSDFVNKSLAFACIQTFTDQFLSSLIEATKLYILTSVWMSLTFIQGGSCMKNPDLLCPFSGEFRFWFGWSSVYATTCWFVEVLANFFCTNNVQGRELCWCDFIKYTFNNVMCHDTCEPIYFKLSMMLDATKLFNLSVNDLDVHSRS